MANATPLITQLRTMEHLTRTEAQIARIRVAQARTDAVRRELRQNGADAEQRTLRITAQLRLLEAPPDVIGPALDRVRTLVKSTVEQAQPLDEALFGDLALEHQLLDRARYLRVLAARAHEPAIERLADDLVAAHTETVAWLSSVLAAKASEGTSALAPTPLQRMASGVTHAARLPARFAAHQVNMAVATAGWAGEHVRSGARDVTGTATQVATGSREVFTAARDAALHRAERVARRDGAETVAEAVHETRSDLGSLQASELPIKHFEEMTAQEAVAALRGLSEPDDLTAMIAFERSRKNRSDVLSAARTRRSMLAGTDDTH